MFERQSQLDVIMELCLAGPIPTGCGLSKLTKKVIKPSCFATFAEACLTHLKLIHVRANCFVSRNTTDCLSTAATSMSSPTKKAISRSCVSDSSNNSTTLLTGSESFELSSMGLCQ